MNTPINDGGPAWPCETADVEVRQALIDSHNKGCQISHNDIAAYTKRYPKPGMSLRDWFAGQIVPGLVTSHEYGSAVRHIFDPNNTVAASGDVKETPQHYLGRIAYRLADGMLAARATTNPATP